MKHKQVKQSEFYKAEGKEMKRLKKVCNRCGDGTFMAEHKDRRYCGKCGMTVWKTKEDTKPAKPTKPTKKEKPEVKQPEPKPQPKPEPKIKETLETEST
jgi:small subunit ribosomal protein S27Ae